MPLSFQGRTIGEVYYGDENRVLHKIGEAHYRGQQVYTSWEPRIVTVHASSSWSYRSGDDSLYTSSTHILTLLAPVTSDTTVVVGIFTYQVGDVIPVGTEISSGSFSGNANKTFTFTEVRT